MSAATRVRNLLMAATAAFLLPLGAPRADGALTHVGSLRHGDQRLDIDMFSENGHAVALLSIARTASGAGGGASHISLAAGPQDWSALQALWTRSRALLGAGQAWSPVGDLQESGTADPTRLTLSAGPTVRLVMVSPRQGAFAFELRPEEAAGFDAVLQTVATGFSEEETRLGEASPG